jgi:hypothetical protein
MATPERYSDKRLEDSFTAYVLLSEPIQFPFPEIWEAVREDYPDLAWAFALEVAPPFDSSKISMGTFLGERSADSPVRHALISFLSTPGAMDMDTTIMIQKSRFAFPEAAQAIAAHRSVFSVSVSSVDGTFPARFDAARRMTCLTAIFAKLPSCVAIYFPSADLILPPKSWVAAADMAYKGKFPMMQWINFTVTELTEKTFTANTIGCAAFNGHEVCMPVVRLDPSEAFKHVYAATVMMLEYGHEYRDGDTMGDEEGTLKLRIRHCAEGVHGCQTDTWFLFHPNSVLDELETFGERPRRPPPPGVDNTFRGDEGWLKKSLRLFGAARRGKPH